MNNFAEKPASEVIEFPQAGGVDSIMKHLQPNTVPTPIALQRIDATSLQVTFAEPTCVITRTLLDTVFKAHGAVGK